MIDVRMTDPCFPYEILLPSFPVFDDHARVSWLNEFYQFLDQQDSEGRSRWYYDGLNKFRFSNEKLATLVKLRFG